VLVELRSRFPDYTLIVRSALDAGFLKAFLRQDLEVLPSAPEAGLVMRGPHTPDLAASWQAYLALHRDWRAVVRREAQTLRSQRIDLLIADIPYAGIAGAALAGVPAVAVCSLHWGEVVARYFAERPEAEEIVGQIRAAYADAGRFFLPLPRRRVPGIPGVQRVGLLARWWGRPRRRTLIERAGAYPRCRIGLISFGGIRQGLPPLGLPDAGDWIWLAPGGLESLPRPGKRPACLRARELKDLSHLDLLASSDLVVTKTGYSTFAECLHFGVPCLFVPRPDWPEAEDIERFMTEQGVALPVAEAALSGDGWLDTAEPLLASRPAPLQATGHIAAVDWLTSNLAGLGAAAGTRAGPT
jgi:hypothetical protein